MCDIWRCSRKRELDFSEIETIARALRPFATRNVVLSGGEPLLRRDIFAICRTFQKNGIMPLLITNGLLLEELSGELTTFLPGAMVSIDGSRAEIHDAIRGVNCFDKVVSGIRKVKNVNPGFRIVGRTTVQKANYFDLPDIVRLAKEIGLDMISFIAADVTSPSFGRSDELTEERRMGILLAEKELAMFKKLLEKLIERHSDDFRSGFIAETPERLWRIYRYYGAMLGKNRFPQVSCNAPWASLVIESDGQVRPCFFQPPIGNLRQRSLKDVVCSPRLRTFRKNLNPQEDPVCVRCVLPMEFNFIH